MKLPKINDIITTEQALELCKHFNLDYLIKHIESNSKEGMGIMVQYEKHPLKADFTFFGATHLGLFEAEETSNIKKKSKELGDL